MKPDQERVRSLLADTVALLCKNGLHYRSELRVQGLLGITVDTDDVFIVHIDECFTGANVKLQADAHADSVNSETKSSPEPEKSVKDGECQSQNSEEQTTTSNTVCRLATTTCSIIGHRQRRKQRSPKRERLSIGCKEFFTDREDDFAINNTDTKEQPDEVEAKCYSSVKTEPSEIPSSDEKTTSPLPDLSVKQEISCDDDDDVIIVGSKDSSPDSAYFPLDFDNYRLQAQAEEMAANWLSGMSNPSDFSYGPLDVGVGQRQAMPNSLQPAALHSHISPAPGFSGCSIVDTMPDYSYLNSSTPGCSSWPLSSPANHSTTTLSTAPVLSSGSLSAREVGSFLFTFSL